MQEFDALLSVAETLLWPGGCPWDQKQTFATLQPYVLEEAHEVIEAVDHNDDDKIAEELGDLLYTVVFFSKVAEKEGRFSLKEIIGAIKEKLVRRHPHVFGAVKVTGVDEVMRNWEKIKKEEKSAEKRESALDGLPPTLPTLIKAQKIVKKMRRVGFPALKETEAPITESEAAVALWELVARCDQAEIDLESALRKNLKKKEEEFRSWEAETGQK